MTTTYYCQNCKESFEEEEKLPNIFKTHGCGSSARILTHNEGDEGEVE